MASPDGLLWIVGFALAAVATLTAGARYTPVDLFGDSERRPPAVRAAGLALQAEPTSPLTGTWRTVANGDRVTSVLRDGTTVWSATEGGGLLRWSTVEPGFRQWLAPQDGLPSNDIRDLSRAPDGALWLATAAGVVRFDPAANGGNGAVTDVLDPERSAGMPSRSTTAVLADESGALWVGFEQLWDPDLAHPLAARGAPAGAFAPGGLARYEPGTREWTHHFPATVKDPPPGDPDPELRFTTLPSDNVTDIEVGTDGTLWVATRPYYLWDTSSCSDGPCLGDKSYWLFAGGGLAAMREGQWRSWRPTFDSDTSCYDVHVNALEPGAEGRMWVGTFGRGLLMMSGFEQTLGCASGQAYYVRSRDPDTPGLRGNVVRAVSREAGGALWLSQGQGAEDGLGVARFDPKGTFDDSSASPTPWISDDGWAHYDVDDLPGPVDLLVTALDAGVTEEIVLGTIDERVGDGHGLRYLSFEPTTWNPRRSADTALPSNQITGLAHDDTANVTWFATKRRGLARLDHDSGSWRHHRAFLEGGTVATVTGPSSKGMPRVAVDLADEAAFTAALPGTRPWIRLGEDPTLYRVEGFIAERSGLGPFLDLAPPLQQAVEADSEIQRIVRGPAGDRAGQIVLRGDGQPWAGAFKDRFQAAGLDGSCEPLVDCWLEGGIGGMDMASPDGSWEVYQPADSPLGQFDVATVEIDLAGRVWMGVSDLVASGDGMVVLDPEGGAWETHKISANMPAGNGVSDLALDPATGHIWSAHLPVERRVMRPGQPDEIVNAGGGVSRYDGERWRSWTKRDTGSRLAGAGDWGVFYAVLADRVADRIWTGGWDGSPRTVHWPSGSGADAVVNWCPIDSCEPADWQHETWEEEGLVSSLAQDARGRLWAGTHRFGRGKIPAAGGIKLWDGAAWSVITPGNSGLPSNQVTVLAAAETDMWAGTLARGAAHYVESVVPPPSPTPTATSAEATPTTIGTPSATASATREATPDPAQTPSVTPTPLASATATPSETPGTPGTPETPTPTSASRTETPSATPTRTPVSTATPDICAQQGAPCRALLPALFKGR